MTFPDPETHNDLSTDDFAKAMEMVKQKIKQISTTVSTTKSTLFVSSSSLSYADLSKKETAKQLMDRSAGNNPN